MIKKVCHPFCQLLKFELSAPGKPHTCKLVSNETVQISSWKDPKAKRDKGWKATDVSGGFLLPHIEENINSRVQGRLRSAVVSESYVRQQPRKIIQLSHGISLPE